jgi:DNA (cytosine-5)-methyltransferase 1
MEKTVAELFAGVGGFRVGLNNIRLSKNGKVNENKKFYFVYVNQWEPSTKKQDAFDCYVKRFGSNDWHINEDISMIDKNKIPNHNLLVAGFPCQDYSVARTKSNEKGIQGKKGVLWWEIHEILKIKKTPFVLLENVDRLLKSPSNQRGRDFGIMLKSLSELGYNVEWRVINAADYGHVQRRKRVFIFCFLKSTKFSKSISKEYEKKQNINIGIFKNKFPIENDISINYKKINLNNYIDLIDLSENGSFDFKNSGLMIDGYVYSVELIPKKSRIKSLSSILLRDNISSDFFINDNIERIKYLKNSKKIQRKSKITGYEYTYSEGKMTFPDDINKPSRTMLTSEGTENRSSHVIKDIKTHKLRFLTPVESERLNEFPDNWTNTNMSKRRRYFMMGNALVVGVVRKLGDEISSIIDNE